MEGRFHTMEHDHILGFADVLDPRLEKVAFGDTELQMRLSRK